MRNSIQIVLLDDVTATTTGIAHNVEGLSKITVVFTRTNHTSGSSVFSLLGSVDGVTFVTLAMIRNLANAITEGVTRVTTETLSSNTSVIVFLDEFVGVKIIRCDVTETTDGTHRATLFAQ